MKISLSNIKDWFFKSTPVKSQNKLQTQREELCLELLSDESSNAPNGDVVFVHGLGGDPYATWSTSSEETHWGKWIAASRPDLRVWTLGFPASPSAWLGTVMPLQDRAVNVLALMKSDGIGRRPAVFITHSMGGLVVKQMLREALFSGTGEYKLIGQSVRGIMFLSTPHTGSDVALLVNYLGFFLRTTVAIEELEAHGAQLRELNRWYRNHVEELGIKTLVFFENQRTLTFTVVNASSADPGVPKVTPIGIDADHIQICKPASQKSLVYKATQNFLDEVFPTRASGEGVKRQLSTTSEWAEKKGVQWVLVLSGTFEDIDKEQAEAIVQHLRQLSGDMHLTIRKVGSGSVKLTIESSEDGFQRIKTLFARGQLHDVLGFEILGIEVDQEARSISETSEGKIAETTKDQHPIEIFFSYSHQDEEFIEKLIAHLSPLKRSGMITGWHDRQISAGTEWRNRIDEHLESAGVILLLVSSDFLASDYCYEKEMGRAMERHHQGTARVIPIILRNCYWIDAPFGELQVLPKDGKPITSWGNMDDAFTNVVLGIKKAIAEMTNDIHHKPRTPEPDLTFDQVKTLDGGRVSADRGGVAFGDNAQGNVVITGGVQEELHHQEVIAGQQEILARLDSILQGQTSSGAVFQSVSYVGEVSEYASVLSKEIKERLELIHEKYRRGKVEDAYDDCKAIRADTELWRKLGASDQATVLLRLARYALNLDVSADEIRELMAQAKALDASLDNTIIRAMLCSREDGAEAGLSDLGEPKTITTFNLRLSLLFQASRYDDLLAALQDPPAGITPDTESDRFHALALLAKGTLVEARAKIEQALSEHSDWEFVQITAAMIDYWSGMATGLTMPKVVAAPAPTGRSLAKSDPESLKYFSKAERRFASLIESTQRDNEQRRCFETWRLASLANDSTKQQEAATYSHELLARDPAHHRVLLWAMAYKYPFDAQPSETALENGLDEAINADEGLVIEITTTLCALYLRSSKQVKAQSLLDKTKEYFVRNNAGDVWAFWQTQRMLTDKEFDEAHRVAAQVDDILMRRRLETMTLQEQSIETHDFSALARHLETSFQETGDPHFLLEFCELSFELRDWEAIVKYAHQLLESAGNASTVGLAASACWNSGRHISTLAILERQVSLFPAQRLPDYLWRLKVMCLLRSGRTSEAIDEAKAIARSVPTTDNLQTCVNACVQMGDLLELRAVARALMERDDVQFETLAKMADLLSVCDPELAKKYLLRALDGLLEHPLGAAFLYYTASRLSLEREIGPFFRQIVDNYPTEVTGVRAIPLKEFPEQQQQMREKRRGTTDQYGKGSLPIHFIASNGNLSLAELMHAIPEWNRRNFAPRRRMAIYSRHGGHLVKTQLVENSTNWRIHADITSLIIAESLGILDKIEEAFGPIVISPKVQASLIWQMNHLSPQASQVKSCQNILRMHRDRKFRLASLGAEEMASSAADSQLGNRLLALTQKARDEGGYVVTYLPLSTLEGEPVTIPPELADHVINCRAVLESLKEQCLLTDSEYNKALHGLGSEGRKEAVSPTLTMKSKLFLDGNIAETMEGAGLLYEVCECFDVYVDEQQIEWATQQTGLDENTEQLQEWLSHLIGRLRAGLESDRYRTISIPDILPDEVREGRWPDSLEMQCFGDLLLLEPHEGNVIWVDDRFFNRHSSGSNNTPIIAISEMLNALRSRGKLDEDEYYEKLLALRTGNFRYIPLNQFEILYHLKDAPFKAKKETDKSDEIVETRSLKKLRCSIAASLLDQGRLEPVSERWFLHSVAHTVKAAILLLWKDNNIPIERARACSNWIFENLFVSSLGFTHLFDPAMIHPSFADAMGKVLGDYLANGFAFDQDSPTGRARQFAYFEWLYNRIVAPCFNTDAETIVTTARGFRGVLGEQIPPQERSEEEWAVSIFLMLLNLNMPAELTEALEKELAPDPEVCKKIGIPSFEMIRIGPLRFSADSLLEAVENAWRDGSAMIRAIGEGEPFTLIKGAPAENGKESFRVQDASGKILLSVSDDVWKLLYEDRLVREEILRRNRFWFDCDQQTFELEIKEISAIESFRERFNRVDNRRGQSAAAYYKMLPQLLLDETTPEWSEMLPPSIAGLLQHYRLQVGSLENSSVSKLSQSAETLLIEEGLSEALERFACLPLRMPKLLVTELTRLPREEKIGLLRNCAMRWASPLSSLHMLDLILRVGDGEEDFLFIARSVLAWLFDEEKSKGRFSFFRHTLCWVSVGLRRVRDTKQLDVVTRLLLVWAHAARLQNIYGQVGEGITFPWAEEQAELEKVYAERAYLNDAIHPLRVNLPVFLIHGLSAVFADQDKKLVDELKVSELISTIALTKSDGRQATVFQLLFDPTLATNQTESFLGGDRTNAVCTVLGDNAVSLLSPANLRGLVKEALEGLINNPEQVEEWMKILAVTDDLPLPAELAESFREMIEKLDLLAIYKASPEVAAIAIRVIASQLLYMDDDAFHQRFERDLLQIVLQENGQTNVKKMETLTSDYRRNIGKVIFEIALRAIFRESSGLGEQVSTEGLLLRLVEYAAQFRDMIPGLFRVIHGMPPDKAWRLWPVLLAARATA